MQFSKKFKNKTKQKEQVQWYGERYPDIHIGEALVLWQ